MNQTKEPGSVISANTFRSHLGLNRVEPAKHKLVVWPNGANPPSMMTTLKCINCTKGILTLPAEVVRSIVAGNEYFRDFFLGVAWGSWGICRQDLDEPLRPPTTPS
jgi:hypothetical protein